MSNEGILFLVLLSNEILSFEINAAIWSVTF